MSNEQHILNLCQFYLDYSFGKFPNVKTPKDIKKSLLFKIVYKFTQETSLSPDDQFLYIRSQVDIFFSLTKKGYSPHFQPSCLVGEKAMKRWLMWKRIYDRKGNQYQEDTTILVDKNLIKSELLQTKRFLQKRLNPEFDENDIDQCVKDGRMKMWIETNQVSPYFVSLCPQTKGLSDLNTSSEIKEFFKKEFLL